MPSITGSPGRARVGGRLPAPAACSALAAALLVSACFTDIDRDRPPALILSPATALQGAALTVLLTAPGAPLAECEGLSPGSLAFAFGDEPAPIETIIIEPYDADTLRARLLVAMDAVPGEHEAVLVCGASTRLQGRFTVRERLEDAAIALEPAAIKAGSFNAEITITGDGIAFDEELSHVVFGDGEHVTIRDQEVVTGLSEMRVHVDVDPLAPEGPMDVAVVTGELVARGEIEILPRDTPWIAVDPDYLVLDGDGTTTQTTHEIVGTGVAFVQPGAEADGGPGDGQTAVAFPENPGLAVASIDVNDLDPSTMSVTVVAQPGAAIGTTPLTVTTGGESVSAAFTVLPPAAGPFLRLAPGHVARNGAEVPVAVRGFGTAPFGEADAGAEAVAFDEEGCDLRGGERVADDELILRVAVDADYAGDACTLRVGAGGGAPTAILAVVAPRAPTVTGFASVAQGATGVWRTVTASDADGAAPLVFDWDSEVRVSARSGVGVYNQSPADEGKSLVINIAKVADDAPVGPAALAVVDDGVAFSTGYLVTPAPGAPYTVSVSPSAVPARRREVELRVAGGGAAAGGMAFDADAPPSVRFDTPALRAVSVEVVDPDTALVRAAIAPSADVEAAVLYVDSNGRKAAASLIVVAGAPVSLWIDEPEIARSGAEQAVFLEAPVPAGIFRPGPLVGEIHAGAGVELLGAVLYPDDADPDKRDEVYLHLRVAATGPGGWIGALLTDGRVSAVLPLHVAGDDESLTMAIAVGTPDGALRPGDRGVAATAVLPGGVPPFDALSEARAGSDGAWAAIESGAGDAAVLVVDVGVDAAPVGDAGVPLIAITGAGAAVGFAPFVAAPQETLSDGSAVELSLDPLLAPVAEVDATTEAPLALVVASAGDPAHADATAEIVGGDALSAADISAGGLLWLFDPDGIADALLVRPPGDPGGLAAAVALRSYGGAVIVEAEDAVPDPLGDPCAAPALVAAQIGQPLDEDWYAVAATATCPVVAIALGREFGERPWASPDALLELRDDASGYPLVAACAGWPDAASADPRIYFDLDAAHPRVLRVAAELASAGAYFLHVRRAAVLREICAGADGEPPFVELDLRPGADLAGYELRLVDPDGGWADLVLPLAGTVPADGLVVVGPAGEGAPDVVDGVGVTAFPAGVPYAVQLVAAAAVVDAIQVDGAGAAGEGTPVSSDGAPRCYARPVGIDTDDNAADFVPGWIATPGA